MAASPSQPVQRSITMDGSWSLSFDVAEQSVRAVRGWPRPTLSGLVGLDVLGEVVAPHEPLAALLAAEAFLSGVRAEVPLQLV